MACRQKRYSLEFKLQVIDLIKRQKLRIVDVSRDLEVGKSTIERWLWQWKQEQLGVVPAGHLPLSAEQRRIRELEKQVHELTLDNQILKKASAYFARALK